MMGIVLGRTAGHTRRTSIFARDLWHDQMCIGIAASYLRMECRLRSIRKTLRLDSLARLCEQDRRQSQEFFPDSTPRLRPRRPWLLHLPDPFAIVPHRAQRGEVSAVEKVARGGAPASALEVVPGVARADGHELKHA